MATIPELIKQTIYEYYINRKLTIVCCNYTVDPWLCKMYRKNIVCSITKNIGELNAVFKPCKIYELIEYIEYLTHDIICDSIEYYVDDKINKYYLDELRFYRELLEIYHLGSYKDIDSAYNEEIYNMLCKYNNTYHELYDIISGGKIPYERLEALLHVSINCRYNPIFSHVLHTIFVKND